MKPVITTQEAVQFMQHLRSAITDDALRMSDLKLELADIEVDTMTETFFYKVERYIPKLFEGADYGNVVEIWRFTKSTNLDMEGGQSFELECIEQTFQ
ncbi:reticulon-like protein [Vibrio phage VAP7]|uniref:Reticulon-like protein n=1 Tax=Vibrio phage VAP7 TaxID=2584487 RepID=A0A4Y5TVA4_9CAUD|nr:reticulon-like protein [Vibrio phage VAP7]QDB73303.1 reticulon-like protein [Vibrio phage VAP7]UFD98205.1 hypothetical protein [Vibrio phage BX-1]